MHRVRDTRRDATPEEVMTAVAEDLFDGDVDDVAVPDDLVTQSLDKLILGLIALRDDETHGTGLRQDIEALFDVNPSPGTIYPRLHELEADDILRCHELIQTKQYSLSDEDRAADRIERAMYHHLTVGLFLHAALDTM